MSNTEESFDAAVILNKKTGKQTTILYGIPDNAKDIYQPIDMVKVPPEPLEAEKLFQVCPEGS